MDNIKLTADELQILRSYISKRGFNDPAIQIELLDHFACKVEEALSQQPGMDLNTAMQAAYFSFGFNGFKNMAKALERYTKRRYYDIYWKKVTDLVMSWTMPLFFALGYLCYSSLVFAATHNKYDYIGFNLASDIIISIIMMAIGYRGLVFSGHNKFYLKMARRATVLPFLAGFLTLRVSMGIAPPGGIYLGSALASFFFIVFCVHFIADYKSLLIAEKEDKEVEQSV